MQKQLISERNTVTSHPILAPTQCGSPNLCYFPVDYCLPVDHCLSVEYCLSVDYLKLHLLYHLCDSLKINIISLSYNSYSFMI